MGEYYVGIKYNQVLGLIKALGLETKHNNSKHTKIVASSGNTYPIPKKHPYLSNGVAESFCQFLLNEGYDKKVIDKYVK
jgi:protoporphyrinogen oxidase